MAQAAHAPFLLDKVARFVGVPRARLREWQKQLLGHDRLPLQLLENWTRLHPDAQRETPTVGGSVGIHNEVLYLITRASQPQLVVETGVAYGFTTSYILQALHDNRCGSLFSIDAPNTSARGYVNEEGEIDRVFVGGVDETGAIIPPILRDRWTLRFGRSRVVLPDLLKEIGPIDIFLHDSDHSMDNMTWEFRTAWSHLTAGGYLLSDDVSHNTAFTNFVKRVGQPSIRWVGPQGRYGGVRTPSAPNFPPP
ncbi:MAG: class I SAM-dependent methyltransferase [Thermoplasmata archaeon]